MDSDTVGINQSWRRVPKQKPSLPGQLELFGPTSPKILGGPISAAPNLRLLRRAYEAGLLFPGSKLLPSS